MVNRNCENIVENNVIELESRSSTKLASVSFCLNCSREADRLHAHKNVTK